MRGVDDGELRKGDQIPIAEELGRPPQLSQARRCVKNIPEELGGFLWPSCSERGTDNTTQAAGRHVDQVQHRRRVMKLEFNAPPPMSFWNPEREDGQRTTSFCFRYIRRVPCKLFQGEMQRLYAACSPEVVPDALYA